MVTNLVIIRDYFNDYFYLIYRVINNCCYVCNVFALQLYYSKASCFKGKDQLSSIIIIIIIIINGFIPQNNRYKLVLLLVILFLSGNISFVYFTFREEQLYKWSVSSSWTSSILLLYYSYPCIV